MIVTMSLMDYMFYDSFQILCINSWRCLFWNVFMFCANYPSFKSEREDEEKERKTVSKLLKCHCQFCIGFKIRLHTFQSHFWMYHKLSLLFQFNFQQLLCVALFDAHFVFHLRIGCDERESDRDESKNVNRTIWFEI